MHRSIACELAPGHPVHPGRDAAATSVRRHMPLWVSLGLHSACIWIASKCSTHTTNRQGTSPEMFWLLRHGLSAAGALRTPAGCRQHPSRRFPPTAPPSSQPPLSPAWPINAQVPPSAMGAVIKRHYFCLLHPNPHTAAPKPAMRRSCKGTEPTQPTKFPWAWKHLPALATASSEFINKSRCPSTARPHCPVVPAALCCAAHAALPTWSGGAQSYNARPWPRYSALMLL